MNRRLKVLHSAFACRPGKGSEPEVGWRWAMGMAQHHDVTVLTQPKHRAGIEQAIAALPPGMHRPEFRYFDGGTWASRLRKRFGGVRLYYIWWQRAARRVVAELHAEIGFDLLHHVTFAGYRYSTAIWRQGVPCIWGPVGGMESIPVQLLPWDNPLALVSELTRNTSNYLQSLPFHVLPQHAAQSTAVLVSTAETQRAFTGLGLDTRLMPAIGIDAGQISPRQVPVPTGPLELLFVGRIISLKGIDLAIRALAASGTNARLTLVGDGSYADKARRLAARLGLGDRLQFAGRLPLAEVLEVYDRFHVFIFPSLHDSGGFAVLEAMARGLPVICLDCGGPAISVREECGVRVPCENRSQIVAGLASAIRAYDEDRPRVAADGVRARASVAEHYEWGRKCAELDAVYEQATSGSAQRQAARRQRASWRMSGALVFTTRGIVFSILILVLIVVLELQGIRRLNLAARSIATETLPSLSSAAVANEKRNESFIKLLLLLNRGRADEGARYAAEIEAMSRQTTAAFRDYEETISNQVERENFLRLQNARALYLEVRQSALADMEANRIAKAWASFEERLLPAFEDYAVASQAITDYSVESGRKAAEEIQQLTAWSQAVLAALGISIFSAGFLLGLSKT